jgi:MFS family permease
LRKGISSTSQLTVVIGNAGVTRTALGELAHNYSWNQGKTFSLFGLCSAIGYIFGPVVGGYLSNPVERFALHGPWGIFVVYPFLLPCCIIATFNLLVIGMSLVFLEETKAPINPPEDVEAPDAHIDETEALLTGRSIEPEVSKSKTQGVYSRTVIACVVSLGFVLSCIICVYQFLSETDSYHYMQSFLTRTFQYLHRLRHRKVLGSPHHRRVSHYHLWAQ